MKHEFIIGIIIISVIVLGFVIGAVLPEINGGCTKMACSCEGVSGERPCNSCFFSDHIFTTGILNVVRQCRASEIIICENDAQVDSRIDLANKKCRTDWYIFGFNLRYLDTNPEETAENNEKECVDFGEEISPKEYDQGARCCSELKRIHTSRYFRPCDTPGEFACDEDGCSIPPPTSDETPWWQCTPCGNGICEIEWGENRCNCLEDCE